MRSILWTVVKRQAAAGRLFPKSCQETHIPRKLGIRFHFPLSSQKFATEQCNFRDLKDSKDSTSKSAMEALRFDPDKKALSLEKVEIPSDLAPNEVIVEVAYAGVCGTDLHIIDGHFPCKSSSVTLGHEFSGVVTKVGAEVWHLKVGDKVAVDPNIGCNSCKACVAGDYHLCSGKAKNNPIGINVDGGWATYCRVNGNQVFTLPESVSLEMGALCEPISCLSHGWDRLSPLRMGDSVLITGAGIIGLLWANVLHLMGFRNIAVCEPVEARRKLVECLELSIDAITPEELSKRQAKDPAYGVNVVIDCSGNAKAIESAYDLLLPGGKLLIFGVSPPDAKVSLSPYKIYKYELTILGSLINPFSFSKALGFLESFGAKNLEYKKLGIEVFKLSEYESAIKKIREGSISKAMFKLN